MYLNKYVEDGIKICFIMKPYQNFKNSANLLKIKNKPSNTLCLGPQKSEQAKTMFLLPTKQSFAVQEIKDFLQRQN